MIRKTLYKFKNLIFLQDGSSVKLKKNFQLKNSRVYLDNYNQNYLGKLNIDKNKKSKKNFQFFNKYTK
jgi:hypothetical protein